MCGVAGYFNINKKNINEKHLRNIIQKISHRGPDGSDFYIEKNNLIGIGHAHLNIIQPDSKKNQPFWDLKKRFLISFNGEIYNYKEIINELNTHGIKIINDNDADVVVNAYALWGEDCVKKFNGMWAFAIWDKIKEEFFISRDRYGIKPIYYYSDKNNFVFSSELKGFIPLLKNLNISFNEEFLIKNENQFSELIEATYLSGVKKLSPGKNIKVKKNKITLSKYWDTNENLISLDKPDSEIIKDFAKLFYDSVNIRSKIHPKYKISCSYSGGVDSESIRRVLNFLKKNNILKNNFKFFFLNNTDDINNTDYNYIKNLKEDNLQLINYSFNSLNTNDIEKCVYFNENVHDLHLNIYHLYQKISQNGFRIDLAGHGGDELLGGYANHFQKSLEMKNFEKKSYNNYKKIFPDLEINHKNYSIISYLRKIFYSLKENKKFKLKKFENFDILNNELFSDFHSNTLPILLTNYDRLSMAFGIESRTPFLDYRLVNYIFSLKSHFKINSSYNKVILREAIQDIDGENKIHRLSKKGFVSNINNILENKSIKEMFLDLSSSCIIDHLSIDRKTYKNKIFKNDGCTAHFIRPILSRILKNNF